MKFIENGLEITVFPPDGEEIAPNSVTSTRVNITNKQHEVGVRLEVSLNLDPAIQTWCKKRKHNITIGHLKSQEVEFIWEIPIQASAGTHNYYLKTEFLRSTSFYSFQPKVRQLTILPTVVKPQIDNVEPTFTIAPATSSTQPITLSCGETLNFEIDVYNRSNKTDNFRVSTDLENSWYVIRYPEVMKKIGVIDGSNSLNLNPREEGKVYLEVTPPSDTLAGNYKPEIELRSLNSSRLFLKKIVYLNIPAEYVLEADFKNILDRVSKKKAQYNILLTNRGNTLRKIDFQVQTSDENECCEYFLEKSSVQIPPNKTVENKLEVQPNSKQKKSFIRTKTYNFQVNLIDRNNYPLPENLPIKSSLHWRSRPLWQSILLFLLIISVLGGCAWGIWRLLFSPQPQPQITFEPEKAQYPYGETIAFKWKVENFQQISTIKVFEKALGVENINMQCYSFDGESSDGDCIQISSQLPQNCKIERDTASCSNVVFGYAKDIKEYTFEVKAFSKKGKEIEEIAKEAKVSILAKPGLKIFEPSLKVSDTEYKPSEEIPLSFEISDINNLVGEDKIFLLINDKLQPEPIITPQNIGKVCSNSSDRFLCEINIPGFSEGKYTIGIELQYDRDGRNDKKPERFVVKEPIVVKTPIDLEYFKINSSDNGTLEVEPGTPITVSWSVTGTNAKVNLDCVGGQLGLQGTKTLNVPEGTTQACSIKVLDESGEIFAERILSVKVKELPEPEKPEPQDKDNRENNQPF